jgi:hypothetical protein
LNCLCARSPGPQSRRPRAPLCLVLPVRIVLREHVLEVIPAFPFRCRRLVAGERTDFPVPPRQRSSVPEYSAGSNEALPHALSRVRGYPLWHAFLDSSRTLKTIQEVRQPADTGVHNPREYRGYRCSGYRPIFSVARHLPSVRRRHTMAHRGSPRLSTRNPCSPLMLQRSVGWRWGSRMRRRKASNMCYSSIGKCRARGKDERDSTERSDKRPTHSMGHGTHHSKGYGAAFLQTPSRAFRAREDILNF